MFLKAALKNSSPGVQLLWFVLFTFLGIYIGSLVSMLLIVIKMGIPISEVATFMVDMVNYPDLLRNTQFITQLSTFIFPAILTGYLFSDSYKEYLRIENTVPFPIVFWTVLSMLCVLPALNWITLWNQEITFPESLRTIETWMRDMEEQNARLIESMLYAENLLAFFFNIMVIAVFAAIGEEWIFRGVFQNIFGRIIRNPHIIIWIVAAIFSAIHFQFYGFIPRLLLGAYFGYLIYYTGNMWVPVLAHFTNNFVGVASFYIFQDAPEKMNIMDTLGTGDTWWLAVGGGALFVFCAWQVTRGAAKMLTAPSS